MVKVILKSGEVEIPGRAGKFHVISSEAEMDEYLQAVREDLVKIMKQKEDHSGVSIIPQSETSLTENYPHFVT